MTDFPYHPYFTLIICCTSCLRIVWSFPHQCVVNFGNLRFQCNTDTQIASPLRLLVVIPHRGRSLLKSITEVLKEQLFCRAKCAWPAKPHWWYSFIKSIKGAGIRLCEKPQKDTNELLKFRVSLLLLSGLMYGTDDVATAKPPPR